MSNEWRQRFPSEMASSPTRMFGMRIATSRSRRIKCAYVVSLRGRVALWTNSHLQAWLETHVHAKREPASKHIKANTSQPTSEVVELAKALHALGQDGINDMV
jgi:hypothetical protein